MVMEAPPSPDSVGREFVRQYYTLLNKAPAHLHRFYNNQSSFLHGGLDPPNRESLPMIGQKQIHQKIQQLNFRDCHAKISQVDSQATLGNGVVVQVTGELSNAGQPMRRFTQTFVLAAQSPKKYYVHNDIFRYQDEIISEEDCDVEARSDVDDDICAPDRQSIGDMQPMAQQQQQPPMAYYTATAAAPIPGTIPQVVTPHHAQPPPPQHVMVAATVPTVNGAIHPEEMNVLPPSVVPPHIASAQPPSMAPPMAGLAMQPQPPMTVAPMPVVDDHHQQQLQAAQPVAVAVVEEGAGDGPIDGAYGEEPPQDEQREATPEPVAVSNEPKTYATLLKSGSYNSPPMNNSTAPQQQPSSITPPPAQGRFDRDMSQSQPGQGLPMGQRNVVNRGNNNGNIRGGNQPRVPRLDSRGGPGRQSINEDDDRMGNRRVASYSDNFQLFLGNLPHNATEDDLCAIFSQYGPIADLRIHSKQNKGGPPGTRITPNYGFITYENQQGVSNCLAAKPIYFPNNDKCGTVLNVEEKKTKDRQFGGPGGGRGQGGDNGRPRGGPDRDNNGGQRRSAGGPGGPNRGGALAGGNRGPPGGFNRGGGGGGPPPNRNQSTTYGNRR